MKKTIAKFLWLLLGLLLVIPGVVQAGRFVLVAEGAGKRVSQFYVSGQTWTYMTNFVDVNTSLGALAPLNSPASVAQDQQGRIYLSDQGAAGANRILRFSTKLLTTPGTARNTNTVNVDANYYMPAKLTVPVVHLPRLGDPSKPKFGTPNRRSLWLPVPPTLRQTVPRASP